MVQKVTLKCEFKAGLCHATTGILICDFLYPPSSKSKWVPFFQLGKDKAVKGEGWALPFISCTKDRTLNLTALIWLLGYGKSLPFNQNTDEHSATKTTTKVPPRNDQ